MNIQPIATFRSPFSSKFGIPKQSGLVTDLPGKVVFLPQFRNPDALRGIEEFDYIWLIWEFSANPHQAKSPVVRPPRLGGNQSVGVFASRSPFRPNPIGLSAVRLASVEWDAPSGPVLHVLGADLMDGTPIYDIKPYVTYADAHPEAKSGFVDKNEWKTLEVDFPQPLRKQFTPAQAEALIQVLRLDPRPQYQNNPQKVYGMPFEGRDVHFLVEEGVLYVIGVDKLTS